MASRRIATTQVDNVRPLGEYGQRSYEYITGVLVRELSERHAALFSEPEDLTEGVAWTTDLPGDIRPLESLDEQDGAALRETLGTLVGDILALADKYAGARDTAAQSLSIALRNAVEVPEDSCIFRVGEQPVIVQWAHHLDVYEPPRGVLSRVVRKPQVPPPAPPVVEQVTKAAAPPPGGAAVDAVGAGTATAAADRFDILTLIWWLGWLLLTLLLVFLMMLAMPACGISGLRLFDGCPGVAEAGVVTVDDDADLEREIARLEREIAQEERACVRQAQREERETQQESEQSDDDPTMEEVLEEKDTSKLAGCWDLESDYTLYIGGDSNRPVTVSEWKVCFDGNGGGEQEVVFTDGTGCNGPVTASFQDDDRLSILDRGDVPCQTGVRAGSSIIQRRTQCDLGDQARAQCWSANAEEDKRGSEVIFRRSQE